MSSHGKSDVSLLCLFFKSEGTFPSSCWLPKFHSLHHGQNWVLCIHQTLAKRNVRLVVEVELLKIKTEEGAGRGIWVGNLPCRFQVTSWRNGTGNWSIRHRSRSPAPYSHGLICSVHFHRLLFRSSASLGNLAFFTPMVHGPDKAPLPQLQSPPCWSTNTQ